MRNLQFTRDWGVHKQADGLLVSVVSRAENDEGEFIVAQQTLATPPTEAGVRAAKSYMLDRVKRDEEHINAGYGRPIEWPLSIRIKRAIRRLFRPLTKWGRSFPQPR